MLQLVKDANNPDLADESTTKESKQSDLKPFDEVVKNTSAVKGLFTLYSNKEGSIYLEIKPEQLNKNYLSTVTMESGIGERGIYSGMPLHDFLFYFRRVNNNLHFVVRNVNFRTSQALPKRDRLIARSVTQFFIHSRLKAFTPSIKLS